MVMASTGERTVPAHNNPQNMKLHDVALIIQQMVERVERLVKQGRRGELLNERFLHHMFSAAICDWYRQHDIDLWDSLILAPEHPTTVKFLRSEIKLTDPEGTLKNAIGFGRSGNLDFVVRSSPAICVEWKGPNLYTTLDSVEVLIKLLKEDVAQVSGRWGSE
jgi:hypothetical protein